MEKEKWLKEEEENIARELPEAQKAAFKAAQEKGASAWLAALPIQAIGYSLNKQEFRDAVSLRYGWKIPGMPSFCACGQRTSVDHTLTCKRGGYVAMRHNALRDTEAFLTRSRQRCSNGTTALICKRHSTKTRYKHCTASKT